MKNDTEPENLPVSSADISYDAQRILENMYASDDEASGRHMVDGVVVVEEDDEESGVDNLSSDDEN